MAAVSAALRSHWRKVSSTDNLQAFAEDGSTLGAQCQGTARSRLKGLAMLLLGGALLALELLVLVCQAWGSPPGTLMQALADDRYYIYLVPLLVPVAVIGVTINWFSLKLFKHNS